MELDILMSILTAKDTKQGYGAFLELSFEIAAQMAFKEACAKAKPVLMEPIMKIGSMRTGLALAQASLNAI